MSDTLVWVWSGVIVVSPSALMVSWSLKPLKSEDADVNICDRVRSGSGAASCLAGVDVFR